MCWWGTRVLVCSWREKKDSQQSHSVTRLSHEPPHFTEGNNKIFICSFRRLFYQARSGQLWGVLTFLQHICVQTAIKERIGWNGAAAHMQHSTQAWVLLIYFCGPGLFLFTLTKRKLQNPIHVDGRTPEERVKSENRWHTDTVCIKNSTKTAPLTPHLRADQVAKKTLWVRHHTGWWINDPPQISLFTTRWLWLCLCLDGALGTEGHVVDQDTDEGGHHLSGYPRAAPGSLWSEDKRRGVGGGEGHQ